MKKYKGKGMSYGSGMSDKDYQPSEKQFAGVQMGKTNEYMARTDKSMDKAGSQLKSTAHKGRYD
ncbi:MAG: hypothetical protein KAS32_29110 [Candidatus Peribacteraceae bacterium]|nr:hypothetical protein [Candidatus Peribacteraceae bacterium]